MLRVLLTLMVLPALLSACASTSGGSAAPETPVECANPVVEGEKDGGLGGTGNAPKPCAELPLAE